MTIFRNEFFKKQYGLLQFFTLILFFLFFFTYIFFYNQDLPASLSAPPPLPGPIFFFDNQGVQASLDAPRLIPGLIYYFFTYTFLCSLIFFYWPGSPIQLKSTTTNSRTDLKKKTIWIATVLSCLYFFFCFFFTYIFFYNWGLWVSLSTPWLILGSFFYNRGV